MFPVVLFAHPHGHTHTHACICAHIVACRQVCKAYLFSVIRVEVHKCIYLHVHIHHEVCIYVHMFQHTYVCVRNSGMLMIPGLPHISKHWISRNGKSMLEAKGQIQAG